MNKILIAVSAKHVTPLAGGIAFATCDIGQAILEDGTCALITWGRNLSQEQAEWYTNHTACPVVKLPEKPFRKDAYEILLCTSFVEGLSRLVKMLQPINNQNQNQKQDGEKNELQQ